MQMHYPAGKLGQHTLAFIGAAFGVATVVAGTRVLLGADPGYEVYRPLLLFNTAMGAAYLGAGLLAWMDARRGMVAAAAIFLLNLAAFVFVFWLRTTGEGVARESIGAMLFRTLAWLVLWLALASVTRRARRSRSPARPAR